jgi:hypothetical protein
MTAGPDTEAFPTYIREMAGCTTGWPAYRPDRIAWSMTTRHPPPHTQSSSTAATHITIRHHTHIIHSFIETNTQSKRKLVRTRSEQSAQHNRQRNKFPQANEIHSTRYLAVSNNNQNSQNVRKSNNKME